MEISVLDVKSASRSPRERAIENCCEHFFPQHQHLPKNGTCHPCVRNFLKDESVKLPADVLLDEQASAYNALIARAENPSDTEELLSLIPWFEARLRRSLKATAVAPEIGNQQA